MIVWLLLLMVGAARAEQLHLHGGAAVPELQARFYETWQSPYYRRSDGARYSPCCNRADCQPVEIVYRDGKVFVRGHRLLAKGQEMEFPWQLIEDMHYDARESPDGFNHACLTRSGPLCLVRGSQT